jgi:protein gp37
MDQTKIRWTDTTWNPMTGCTKISPGCKHCYAEVIATKFEGKAFPNGFAPTFKPHRLSEPARWKSVVLAPGEPFRPRRVFVNSMSDLFHEDFTDEQIDRVFNVMAMESQHDYQVLTKRPERMRDYVRSWLSGSWRREFPPQIWLGVSIENDDYTWRADVLREIPAPVKFLSIEPLLGPVPSLSLEGIQWAIVGGESGKGYRPMDHAWARDVRDGCVRTGTAFFFKQSAAYRTELGMELDGKRYEAMPVTPRGPGALE